MALRRAHWLNDAEAWLEHHAYAVCYKHHLDRVMTNPGEETIFFQYRARQTRHDDEGSAWEWGERFKWMIEHSGKIVIAEPEWEGGKLVKATCIDCHGNALLVKVEATPFEIIKIGYSPHRESESWTPEGYANPSHLWNHIDLRQR